MNSDTSVGQLARPVDGSARPAAVATGERHRLGPRPALAGLVERPVQRTEWFGGERGSLLPLLALVAVGVVIATGLITVTADRHIRTARAQWAADAAALAAATVGVDSGGAGTGSGPNPGPDAVAAAKALAEANGARLISIGVVAGPSASSGSGQQTGNAVGATIMRSIVVIRVEYGGVQAESAAQRLITGNP